MRVLVTGIGGYVTSNIALRMSRSASVVGLGRATKFPLLRRLCERIELVEADIADAAVLAAACRGADVVVHGAGPIVERWCTEQPEEARRVIVDGTRVVSDAARRAGARLIHLSTLSVYSTHRVRPQPVDEESELLPDTVYGTLKAEAERQAFADGALVLRISNVFGSGCAVPAHPHVVTTIFAERAARGQPLVVAGDGTEAFDFIHIDDVSRLVEQLAQEPPPLPAVFNVSYGSPIELRALAELTREAARDLVGRDVEINYQSNGREPRPSRWLANERVRRLAPWFPAVSTRAGMREMVERAAQTQHERA